MAIKQQYRGIVGKGIVASIAAGPLGAIAGPLDAPAVLGIWTTMLVAICQKSGHNIDQQTTVKIVTSVGTAATAYYAGCKMATMLFHLVPGAGTVAAMGASSAMNALFTYKFGSAISEMFDRPALDISDVLKLAGAVISLVCTLPTFSEVSDMVDMVTA